jgi:hypothetical protein
MDGVNPIPGLNGTYGLPLLTGPAQPIAQATGLLSRNSGALTTVLGTDLGVMWDNGAGEVLTAFGDSASLDADPLDGTVWSWKSNILLRSGDRNLADGMDFSSTPLDESGISKELITGPKIPGVEISKIPTAGVAVGNTQIMSIMSVRTWEAPGAWSTNWSALATSTDNGENWALVPGTERQNSGGNANFQMNAFLKDGGYVYEYGTRPGRGGSVYVARVTEGAVTNLGAYEYWNGSSWVGGNPDAAQPIVNEGVGELSVAYN